MQGANQGIQFDVKHDAEEGNVELRVVWLPMSRCLVLHFYVLRFESTGRGASSDVLSCTPASVLLIPVRVSESGSC